MTQTIRSNPMQPPNRLNMIDLVKTKHFTRLLHFQQSFQRSILFVIAKHTFR